MIVTPIRRSGGMMKLSSSVVPLFGEAYDDIAGLYHAKVAMGGFCRVEEDGGCACGRHGGCHFLADDAGFPHTGNNDFAFAFCEGGNCFGEVSVKPFGHSADGPGFLLEDCSAFFDYGGAVHLVVCLTRAIELSGVPVFLKR